MRSPFSLRTPRAPFLLALLCCPLAACDSSGDDDVADGTFEARISGAAQARLGGQAAFAFEAQGERAFSAIGLFDASDDEDAVFLYLDGPAMAKPYPVNGIAAGAFLVLQDTGRAGAVYIARSGTITVTRADAAQLNGSFDVLATSLVDQDAPVRLRGSFSAKPGTVAPPWSAGQARGQ